MLYADKRALENNLMVRALPPHGPRAASPSGLSARARARAAPGARQVSLIEIRQKELDFYTRNCISIGTQAALLSGFAYAGIIQVAIPESCPDLLKAAYLSMTVCTMTVHLIALVRRARAAQEHGNRSACVALTPHILWPGVRARARDCSAARRSAPSRPARAASRSSTRRCARCSGRASRCAVRTALCTKRLTA